jgi:DNA-binding MarR family transcriptional regulator
MELTIKELADQLRGFAEYLQRVGAELFDEAFKTQGVKALSLLQLRYLEIIEGKPGISPGELTGLFNVKKPTVTNIVNTLENSGLVRREKSADDGRVCRLHPTDRTVKIFTMRRGMYGRLASHVAGKLDKAEIKGLARLFRKIVIEEEEA